MDSLALNALPTHPTKVHPRTGEPLRALAIRPNGEPLWPMMGGDGSEGDANDNTGDGAGGGGEGSGNDDPNDAGNGEGEDNGEDGDEQDPRVQRANRQAANYRTQLRETQERLQAAEQSQQETSTVLDRLRAAITGEDGDGEGDPAEQVTELTTRVESLTSENADLQRALLVYELAGEANGNPTALLDSRRFGDTIRALDASADNYREQVAEAIRTAVQQNRAYRAGQGSGQGGAEFDGERREQQRQRPRGGLSGAIGAAYSGRK